MTVSRRGGLSVTLGPPCPGPASGNTTPSASPCGRAGDGYGIVASEAADGDEYGIVGAGLLTLAFGEAARAALSKDLARFRPTRRGDRLGGEKTCCLGTWLGVTMFVAAFSTAWWSASCRCLGDLVRCKRPRGALIGPSPRSSGSINPPPWSMVGGMTIPR